MALSTINAIYAESTKPSSPVDTAKSYRIVSGLPGTPSATDLRPSSCLGLREIDGELFLGVADVAADAPEQIWNFVADSLDPATFAITNQNGQYINPIAGLYRQGNFEYQDARFAIVDFDGELPDEAFGFAVIPIAHLTETETQEYRFSDITGIQPGDLRCRIMPLRYRNSFADEEQIVDNTPENAPSQVTDNAKKPPYYMNIAGTGRKYLINLWFASDECQSIVLVPTERDPDIPTHVDTPAISGVTTDNDGNAIIGKNTRITLKTSADASILYRFDSTADFTTANSNPFTLTITEDCTLEYCAEKNNSRSDTISIRFSVVTTVEADKSYRIVSGLPGTPSATDLRPSSCLGLREIDGELFLGVADVAADAPEQIWNFVADSLDPATFAITNQNGQYINPIAGLYRQGNFEYQDARFAIVDFDGELPDEAFGFAVVPIAHLTEAEAQEYRFADITGMQPGDLRCRIMPLRYRNSFADEEQIADNTPENAPSQVTDNAKKPPYYMNIAGTGRKYLINLWFASDECQSVVLVPAEHDPDTPKQIAAPSISGVTTDSDGNVIIASEISVTLTAVINADIMYRFTADGETPAEAFTIADNNPFTLTIDNSGVLEYYAAKGNSTSETKSIKFKILTDSIENISAGTQPHHNKIHDLFGRRLNSEPRGLYIVNGKKMLRR